MCVLVSNSVCSLWVGDRLSKLIKLLEDPKPKVKSQTMELLTLLVSKDAKILLDI